MPGMTVFQAQEHQLHTRLSYRRAAHSCTPLLLLLVSLRSRYKKPVEGTMRLLKQWELAASASFQLLQVTALAAFNKTKQLAGGEKRGLSQRRKRVKLWAWASQAALALKTLGREFRWLLTSYLSHACCVQPTFEEPCCVMLAAKMRLCSWRRAVCHIRQTGTTADLGSVISSFRF